MRLPAHILFFSLLIFSLYPLSIFARRFVLVLSQDDLKDPSSSADEDPAIIADSSEWDEFGDSDAKPDDELDPGSWRPIFEPDSAPIEPTTEEVVQYYNGVSTMISAVGLGNPRAMEAAATEFEALAAGGNPHAQSALGFLYQMGTMRERNRGRAFMYHYFAAEGGNVQSRMALAYTYSRQDAKEFFEMAAENEDAGGNYNLGVMYLKGIGVKRDVKRACEYFIMAANLGQPKAFYQLAKMFHTGVGLKKNLPMRYYDQALEIDPAAKLPVTLALASLWIRKNYANSVLVDLIDSLPEVYPKVEAWVQNVILEEGNATILTLFVCLLTVLYLRERQRRNAVGAAGDVAPLHHPNEHGAPAPN
ncbi:hypothetical protein L1049_027235 [Liquidambar formosana]|uniref:Uncharacterized protein n=1 Tax=Liquidambar formosana TaxID=63359 RepID=A0AAP0QYG7_LIQFO